MHNQTTETVELTISYETVRSWWNGFKPKNSRPSIK